jgi:hypothetical protein
MYNILENLPILEINNTKEIFNYLNTKKSVSIEDIIIKIGILTLKSNSLNTLEISTNNFTFLAKRLDNNINSLKISNFQLEVPKLNINNTVMSMISWNTNPYLLESSILLDTNVNSISLSDINGTIIDVKNLVKPIKLSWDVLDKNVLNSNMLEYTGNCYYWNKIQLKWKEDGCFSDYVNKTYISCKCTHLTDFGAKINRISSSNSICSISDNIKSISRACSNNISMYKNFLENKLKLLPNETQQIFDN